MSAVSVATEELWRLNVAQYHAMIKAGILTEDDPVELLEGCLIAKMPKNPRHRLVTQLTREALAALLPDDCYVDAQEPITLLDSEPEPDVVVVRGHRRDYSERHPGAEDVALIVEVADPTLKRDQTAKKKVYAAAKISVYWIINLPENRVEVYKNPSEINQQSDYLEQTNYGFDDVIGVDFDNQEIGQIKVSDLL